MTALEKSEFGYLIRGREYCLQLVPYGEKVCRVVYTKSPELPEPTVAVIARPVILNGQVQNNRLQLGGVVLEVDEEDLSIKIYDRQKVLFSEDHSVDPAGPGLKKKMLWEQGIYGNGEKYGWLNQIGTKTSNFNSDILFHHPIHHPQLMEMHTAISFFIGVAPGKAYGLYFDNSFRTNIDFGLSEPGIIRITAEGGLLDYYYILGDTVQNVCQAYGQLTGTTPLPPRRYLGFQQSRYSYESEAEVLAVAETMREHKIPCDVIYLDIHYMEGFKVFTVDRNRFPRFREMVSRLKELGFAVVVIVNPGVKVEEQYQVYLEGLKHGYYITQPDGKEFIGEVWPKPAVFPDFLRADVRNWWADLHRELIDAGVDGIWNDMNEPSNFTTPSGTLPEVAEHHTDRGEKICHAEAHNLYGLYQTMATRKALEKLQPDRRHFVLTRAAYAGSQRHAALWTGDNSSVWEHLEISIPMILNLGLSGLIFSGADVGGYRGDCNAELMIRWTQLGAFLPFFRNHSEIDTARQEPWQYDEETLAIIREYIRLRYRLLTCYYSLFRESFLYGRPLVRPLFYQHQDDPETYHINDQFLLGRGLMVCPVTRPGIRKRQVYLPSGDWYDFWSGDRYSGEAYINAAAPLNRLPLFVRAGTILPLEKTGEYVTANQAAEKIELNCYCGTAGSCRLYFDDGISNEHLQGCYSEVEVSMSDQLTEPDVQVKIIRDQYPLPNLITRLIGIK